MNKLIYVLDDEQDILDLVALNLNKSGFTPVSFDNAPDFWKAMKTDIPALIVLDLMLPDVDGMDICKEIRKHREYETIPVIMLTAKDDEMDKIIGLELGADDYITKPFSPRELVARVKAIIRRTKKVDKSETIGISGYLKMNTNTYEVWVQNKKVDLTSTEFKLLKLFIEKQGWVFSRDKILDYLWGKEKAVIDRTVDVHVKNLREKLGDAGKFIKNVRGVGYKLELDQ